MRTVVFLLRIDSVNDKPEGEYYVASQGVINCNFWSSPKLVDHQIIIATGETAIRKTHEKYSHFNLSNQTPKNTQQ